MNKNVVGRINKKTVLGAVLGAVVVVAAGAYLSTPLPMSDGYTAITTITNQFFVGRAYQRPLSQFIELREPFLLQNVADAENDTITPQLVDLSIDSYWLPKTILIHIDSIVTKGAVSPESAIAGKIAEYKGTAAR